MPEPEFHSARIDPPSVVPRWREIQAEPSRGEPLPRDWGFAVVAFVLGLLPRLYVAIAWAREPVWDGHYYHFGAERIAAGLGYSEEVQIAGQLVWKPWAHYPVGYSALLGAVYRVFGSGLWVAPVLNAVLGAFLVLVVHRLARKALGCVARARVAALLVAFHPGLILYSALVMTELLAALLLAASGLWLFRRGLFAGLAAGLTLGFGALVRPTTLLLLPCLIWLLPGPLKVRLLRATWISALALLVILPWTLRNCARMDGCALISTNGGWNLAIGALTQSGRFQSLRASDGCPVVTGQVQQDRCWAAVGLRTIRADPGRWLGLIPKKLSQTYDHESFAVEYLREADPEAWPEARRQRYREVVTGFHRVLLGLACFSVIVLPRRGKNFVLRAAAQLGLALSTVALVTYVSLSDPQPFYWLALFIPLVGLAPLPGRTTPSGVERYALLLLVLTSLTHALFFGEDRYHLVISPILCLLAAGALRREAAPELERNARGSTVSV